MAAGAVAAIIDGKEVQAKETFADLDPSSGEVLADVARCGAAEIEQAVGAARRAFHRSWSRTSAAERGRLLRRLGELIATERDSLAVLESKDTGKPLRQAKGDAHVAARYFEFYGGVIEAFYGDTIPVTRDLFVYTTHEPFGVTAHIIPWNYPLQIAARSIAPSLAAGNCCVLKSAEEAPLTSARLGALALEAGLPAGVLNVVPGLGEEAGAALASSPGIDHLAFIGSVEVGRLVVTAAAEHSIPTTLELGGKSPNIVMGDANLDAAVPIIVNSIIQNAGQTCSAGSRLLVQESIHEEATERIADRMSRISIGAGVTDPDLGPLISRQQQDRVRRYVDGAAHDGGRLLLGGTPPEDEVLQHGFYFLPTIFDDVSPQAPIAREEVFGPVLAVTSFRAMNEVPPLANATPYGLLAGIWTRDIGLAHSLARDIQAGQIYINGYGAGGGVELPFGGFKRSGYGREKGFEALRTYSQVKTVSVRIDAPE
jgi:aldehyde dehydrogenase (NAD+)